MSSTGFEDDRKIGDDRFAEPTSIGHSIKFDVHGPAILTASA
jgi:hypothetical protein